MNMSKNLLMPLHLSRHHPILYVHHHL
jgi:hypothetical protein